MIEMAEKHLVGGWEDPKVDGSQIADMDSATPRQGYERAEKVQDTRLITKDEACVTEESVLVQHKYI